MGHFVLPTALCACTHFGVWSDHAENGWMAWPLESWWWSPNRLRAFLNRPYTRARIVFHRLHLRSRTMSRRMVLTHLFVFHRLKKAHYHPRDALMVIRISCVVPRAQESRSHAMVWSVTLCGCQSSVHVRFPSSATEFLSFV